MGKQHFELCTAGLMLLNALRCRFFEKAAHEVLAASKQHRAGGHRNPTAVGCFSFLKKPKALSELSVRDLATPAIQSGSLAGCPVVFHN